MSCNFCHTIRNFENPLYRDDVITALFDWDPISTGHTIILPNDHYLDLDEMPIAVITHLMGFAKEYVGLLKEMLHPKGYSMMQNGGAFNDIHHFHLHVFPRFSAEEFNWTYSDAVIPKSDALQLIQSELSEEIGRRMSY